MTDAQGNPDGTLYDGATGKVVSYGPSTPNQGSGKWLLDALNQINLEVDPLLADDDACARLIALGLAAGSTYLLFYTDSIETLAGQAGAVAQGLGNAVPSVVPV